MADSDYRDDRSDDSRGDDSREDRPRSRRRDDDGPPKKKGGSKVLVILLVVFGVLGVICVGTCGFLAWAGMDLVKKMPATADDFLTKVGSGDYSGAYNSATPAFRAKRSLEQFTEEMKAAKLDKYKPQSFAMTSTNSVNTRHTLGGNAELTDGSSVAITVVIEQGGNGFQFTVDDITTQATGK